MRYVVACVIGLVGCGDDGPAESPRGPDVTAIPAGTGWECFTETIRSSSLCARPGSCASLRQGVIEEFKRAGEPYNISPCLARPRAACFTAKLTTGASKSAACYELESQCEADRRVATTDPDFTEVSGRCGVYP
jgi:hypothetical protein